MVSNVVVKSTVWLERGGAYLIGAREAQLLDAVERVGSIKEAAKTLELSYRTAWARIRELERVLGEPLVRSRAGGAGGGATSLTAEGRELVQRLLDLWRRAGTSVETGLPSGWDAAHGEPPAGHHEDGDAAAHLRLVQPDQLPGGRHERQENPQSH